MQTKGFLIDVLANKSQMNRKYVYLCRLLFRFRSARAKHNQEHQAGQKHQADEELQQYEEGGKFHFDQRERAVLHEAGVHAIQLHPEDLSDLQLAFVEQSSYLTTVHEAAL